MKATTSTLESRRGSRWLPVLVFVTVCLSSAALQAGYRQIHKPSRSDPMAVSIYQLDNGLTVYLTENHETPRFYAVIPVRAGSKHDPAESTGLAHYLEHMLFKGTRNIGTLDFEKEKEHLGRISELYQRHFAERDPEKRKAIYLEIDRENQAASQYAIPNEMDKLYKSMGEEGLNAHTWHEETVYQVGLPINRLDQWARIESERFLRPVFRLFQPELEIVYEEKNRMMDNKEAILIEAVNRLTFKKHPYGQQTTIGEVEHLKNPSLQNLYAYYETHYVPNNMAIAISGDIDKASTIKLIDKHFSAWQSKPLRPPKSWAEPPLRGAERVTVKYKGEEKVQLVFRTVSRNHPDADALALVDMILDNAVAGLINLNLNQQQKVRVAGSGIELNNDYGTEQLWGIPKKDQTLKEVEDLLLEQIELVKQGKFDDWIIPAIITDFKKNRKAGLESDSTRAFWMAGAFIAYQDWDYAAGQIERMARLTKQDVVRAANQHFKSDFVVGCRIDEQQDVPKLEKPPLTPIKIDPNRQSQFAARILATQVKEIEPVFVKPGKDYRKSEWPEGVTLYYSRNPLNDLFALSFNVELGSRHDNRLGIAARFLDKSGTTRLSAEQLKKEWYKLGTSFGMGSGDNETGVGISGLDENFEASLALMLEVMRQPAADKETLDELKKIILVQREDTKKDHRAIAGAVAMYNRYGKDSPYLTLLPNDALEKLTAEELHGLTKGLLKYKLVVSYTGALPMEKVENLLRKHLALSGPLQTPPPYVFLKAAQPPASRVCFFHKEMAQAQVRLEFADGEVDEANFPAVQLFNDYFAGGMSGIVFQELREARALAYAVGAAYGMGGRKKEENIMTGGIGTQPDKVSEAVEAFLELFDNLPASQPRFEETKRSVINHYRTAKLLFREVLGAVRSWERLEVPIDPRRERFDKIQKAGFDLVLDFQRGHLKGKPRLISIVGDRARIDLERLKKNAQINEIELKDIFAF